MKRRLTIVPVALLAASSAAAFGPNWDKDLQEDAGANRLSAQTITATSLVRITGRIAGAADGGPVDFHDVYRLVVTDPGNFLVDVSNAPGGGSANFNTCLYLFNEAGQAQLANNDAEPGQIGSRLRNFASDGSGFVLTQPGVYFLAICGFASQPTLDGQVVFGQDFYFQPGVTSAGATSNPWTLGWNFPGDFGDYSITVTGIAGVPGPGGLAAFVLAGGLIRSRRRRN